MATATPSDRAKCFSCDKEKIIYPCEGCSKKFCLKDLTEHRQNLNKQFEGIENERNQFYQKLTERKKGLKKLPSLQDVDEWKEELIAKIQQTAEEYKQTLVEHNKHFIQIEEQLSRLTAQLKQARQENEFNEIDLDQFKIKLTKLTEELSQPSNIKIQQDYASFTKKISVVISSAISPQEQLNEISLNQIQPKIPKELNQSPNMAMPKNSTSFINKNLSSVSSSKLNKDIRIDERMYL